jgi:hypothetical protein
MTYSEIYKILSFEKENINYNKIIMFTTKNLSLSLLVWRSVDTKFIY